MIRIKVICEGQTEGAFVQSVLNPAVVDKNRIYIPSLIGKQGHKGGNVNFDRTFNDIRISLLQDKKVYVTTLLDFYGIAEDFPGKKEALQLSDYRDRQKKLIEIWLQRLNEKLDSQTLRRFIPYIQMYEFEALLFSSPCKLADSLGYSSRVSDFQKIRNQYSAPESINNSPQSAPSKRIETLIKGYKKTTDGINVAQDIGLDTIRNQCFLFNQWLNQLESLPEIA